MINEKEITEYREFRAALESLHGKFLDKREELRRLLEETIALKKYAFKVLAKANRLTGYLSGRERQKISLSYHLSEIKARIHKVNQTFPVLFHGNAGVAEMFPEIQKDFPERRELRQKVLMLLTQIDRLKKNLLQLDLLELRCRELILSIKKALEAFRCELRIIRRKIYPFGIFSIVYRSLRYFFGKGYFFPSDLDDVAALGIITGHVLKIADSPVV